METTTTMNKKLVLGSIKVMLAVFLIGCSSSLDPILRDIPPLPDGSKILTITTTSTRSGGTLSEYQLTVQAPDGSFTDLSLSEASTEILGATSGTYTITATKSGYITSTKQISLSVPADADDIFGFEAFMFLTQANPSVSIDNAAGGEIVVPAVGNNGSGPGSATTKITIPAGAVAGAGSTDYTITAVPRDPADFSNGASPYTYIFEPSGLVFVTPITVEIPLNLPAELLGVPATFDFVGSPAESLPIDISADGAIGTVQISHFSTYVLSFAITTSSTDGTKSLNFKSGCGEDLDIVVDVASPTSSNPIINWLFQVFHPGIKFTTTIVNPDGAAIIRAIVRIKTETWRFGNITIRNIPIGAYAIETDQSSCHGD